MDPIDRASRRFATAAPPTPLARRLGLVAALGILLCAPVATAQTGDPHDGHPEAHTNDQPQDQDAHAGHTQRPDDHAPIGVMGDHLHPKGGWMASFRYMRMDMEPNRIGTTDVSPSQILRPTGTLGSYGTVPTFMSMNMYMFGLMYAPSDRVTLMGMFPFIDTKMDHLTMTGVAFTTESDGIGDIGFSALIEIFDIHDNQLILNAGMTFPTGSINRTDATPASGGMNVLLPYPMQLGSGTWDLMPGLTYNGQVTHFSWGAQVMGKIRLGSNEQNYTLGNAYDVTGWGAWATSDWVSLSGRLKWSQWFDIRGQDTRLQSPMPAAFPTAASFIPTADPNLRGGERLDIGPGLNFIVPRGPLRGVRLAVEALFPVYQSLDGPQLAQDWTVIAGTQYAF